MLCHWIVVHLRSLAVPMDILFLLIPLSVVMVVLVGLAFWWSVRSGQYDDLEGPAHRIVDDDDIPVERDSR